MFKEKINEYRNDIIRDVQGLVRIKSVEQGPQEGMPFGRGVNDALEFVLNLSENIGMKTVNLDGYVGYADYGHGEETIGVLVHVDVVPAGEGWEFPPYEGVIDDGRIYGRGTNDDKGPAVSVLYAIKAIKDLNLKTNKKIRVIFGTNEETGWKCIDHYMKNERIPDKSFTPDGDFPVVYAEKGLYHFELSKKWHKAISKGSIKSIKGGSAVNCVPDYAEAQLNLNGEEAEAVIDKLAQYMAKGNKGLSYEKMENGIKLVSRGISVHGSVPELGSNAICILLEFLTYALEDASEINSIIKILDKKIGMEYNGQSLGCSYKDEVSGELTLNLGTIDFDGNELKIGVDIRYPVSQDKDIVEKSIEKLSFESNLELIVLKSHDSIYFPKESQLITTLLASYQKVTGHYDSQPVSMSGATYARAFDNVVAFGGVFPDSEDRSHQSNEYLSIDDLMKMTEINTNALYDLAR